MNKLDCVAVSNVADNAVFLLVLHLFLYIFLLTYNSNNTNISHRINYVFAVENLVDS